MSDTIRSSIMNICSPEVLQSRVWQDKDIVRKLFQDNANVSTSHLPVNDVRALTRTMQYYFCGSGTVALGVKERLGDIVLEAKGGSKEEAATFLAQLSKVSRFATDIFD